MPCHYSRTRERKLLQKALKSEVQSNQKYYNPFFIAARKIAGFESPEPILDGGQ
jgi:hypothetical protein